MFEGYDIGQEVFNQPQPHNRHAHSSMGQVSLTGKNIFQPNYVGDKQGSTMLGMTGSGMMGTGGLKRGMRGQKKKFRPTSAKSMPPTAILPFSLLEKCRLFALRHGEETKIKEEAI